MHQTRLSAIRLPEANLGRTTDAVRAAAKAGRGGEADEAADRRLQTDQGRDGPDRGHAEGCGTDCEHTPWASHIRKCTLAGSSRDGITRNATLLGAWKQPLPRYTAKASR